MWSLKYSWKRSLSSLSSWTSWLNSPCHSQVWRMGRTHKQWAEQCCFLLKYTRATARAMFLSMVTSQQAVTFKNTSTQTDTPSRTTVGKWLSTGTLKEHVRSKGTQAVSSLSVGIETTFGSPDFTLSSTPIQGPGFRPRKRPHLEFEEEFSYVRFEPWSTYGDAEY
ncbi:uncharacterized protein LOC121887482 isoform X3 [Thunnus maccoyii]|uniref:uncharacterized protein LOC121887482 isoform X3 n=1 Tax=Thunnus maccoyii TaxID=8240 RepID=UPI001C4C11A6|nr:uncharacterized protein LOC121887482 isoform X3 [Thunnus maccoyii]